MFKSIRNKLILTTAVAAMAIAPLTASAGDDRGDRYRDDRRSDDRYRPVARDDRRPDVRFDFRIGHPQPRYEERQVRVWVEPVYRTVQQRVWIEPEYRVVYDRVWVAPETREVCERVWVPDCYEWRDVVYRDECGRRVVRREQVLVRRGYWTEQKRVVVVRDGCWQNVERREMVCPGRWEIVNQQELVCPGRWEYRTERVAIDEPRRRSDADWFIDILARF